MTPQEPAAFGVTFGMIGDEYRAPEPPEWGKWSEIKPGPRGGKRWRKVIVPKEEPPTPQPKLPPPPKPEPPKPIPAPAPVQEQPPPAPAPAPQVAPAAPTTAPGGQEQPVPYRGGPIPPVAPQGGPVPQVQPEVQPEPLEQPQPSRANRSEIARRAAQTRAARKKAEEEAIRAHELSKLSEPSRVTFHESANEKDKQDTNDLVKSLFGGDPSKISSVAGALGGSRVKIGGRFTYDGNAKLDIKVDHPAVDHQWLTVTLEPNGKTTNHVDLLFLKPRHQGGGLGMKMIADQIKSNAQAGIDQMDLLAGKGANMNGYYTWARLGYDADLNNRWLKKAPERAIKAFQSQGVSPEEAKAKVDAVFATSPKTVLDLMATPDGREVWKSVGYQTEMTFDLNPGSRSFNVLNEYLTSKGKAPIEIDIEAATQAKNTRAANAPSIIESMKKRYQQSQQFERAIIPGIDPAKERELWDRYVGYAVRDGLNVQELSTGVAQQESILRRVASSSTDPEQQALLNDPVALRERAYRLARHDQLFIRHERRMESPLATEILQNEFAALAEQSGVTLQEVHNAAKVMSINSTNPDDATALREVYNFTIKSIAYRKQRESQTNEPTT